MMHDDFTHVSTSRTHTHIIYTDYIAHDIHYFQ